MAGYFGTIVQQRLQARAEESVDFINATPGACQTGRMMGCDDPHRLGWDQIDAILERDGFMVFRMFSAEKADEVRSWLAERNCRFDTWDVFLAERSTALSACEAILAKGLPDRLLELPQPDQPEGDNTVQIETLMASGGVAPFSGSFLVGDCGPAVTVALADYQANVVATAHGYMPHNAFSPFHRHAWGGLVAVAQTRRGVGLGIFINARMIADVFRELGATHVYELVSASNLPSRRMVETCGLRHELSLVCCIATHNGGTNFTR